MLDNYFFIFLVFIMIRFLLLELINIIIQEEKNTFKTKTNFLNFKLKFNFLKN